MQQLLVFKKYSYPSVDCKTFAGLQDKCVIVLTNIYFQGSTPIDLAEPDMVKMLEELKKRQNDKPKINAVSRVYMYMYLWSQAGYSLLCLFVLCARRTNLPLYYTGVLMSAALSCIWSPPKLPYMSVVSLVRAERDKERCEVLDNSIARRSC